MARKISAAQALAARRKKYRIPSNMVMSGIGNSFVKAMLKMMEDNMANGQSGTGGMANGQSGTGGRA